MTKTQRLGSKTFPLPWCPSLPLLLHRPIPLFLPCPQGLGSQGRGRPQEFGSLILLDPFPLRAAPWCCLQPYGTFREQPERKTERESQPRLKMGTIPSEPPCAALLEHSSGGDWWHGMPPGWQGWHISPGRWKGEGNSHLSCTARTPARCRNTAEGLGWGQEDE